MISVEQKLAIIQKVLLNPERKLKALAEENNVGYSTLQKWLKQHKDGTLKESATRARRPQDWTRAERLQAVLHCETLTGETLGAYCRQQGLYPSHITEWKTALMTENPQHLMAQQKRINQKLEAENKALKRDLRRKEKALAEASALLILKKKVDLIWGDAEDV
jgi:transposase-like protein